jgi:hypothetical protein
MKHTPGPWRADSTHVRTAINSIATANNQRKHIAMINITKNPEYEITIEEHEANANLIAAAPDLLGLLMELQDIVFLTRNNELHTLMEAAIAKATGE